MDGDRYAVVSHGRWLDDDEPRALVAQMSRSDAGEASKTNQTNKKAGD